MKVSILFRDNTVKLYLGVRKVTNGSTNSPNDWIYIYRFGYMDGQPSLRFPMTNVICVEVSEG